MKVEQNKSVLVFVVLSAFTNICHSKECKIINLLLLLLSPRGKRISNLSVTCKSVMKCMYRSKLWQCCIKLSSNHFTQNAFYGNPTLVPQQFHSRHWKSFHMSGNNCTGVPTWKTISYQWKEKGNLRWNCNQPREEGISMFPLRITFDLCTIM